MNKFFVQEIFPRIIIYVMDIALHFWVNRATKYNVLVQYMKQTQGVCDFVRF